MCASKSRYGISLVCISSPFFYISFPKDTKKKGKNFFAEIQNPKHEKWISLWFCISLSIYIIFFFSLCPQNANTQRERERKDDVDGDGQLLPPENARITRGGCVSTTNDDDDDLL